MKRCPKCDATYDADAAWCPADGAHLEDALHTLMEDADAGNTLRDIPVSQLTQSPGALTMGWEIPDVADEPPRTTPSQLAAMGAPLVPTTFAGLPTPSPPPGARPRRETSSLRAATLPPAAPRMTPQTLAAALARAPAPHRHEPHSTPTSINVPLPTTTPTSISAQLPSVSALMASVSALLPSEPEPPISAQIPVEVEPDAAPEPVPPRRTAPMATVAGASFAAPTTLAPRSATPSQAPPRRLITEPMRVVLAEPASPVIEPVSEIVPPAPQSDTMATPPVVEMTAPVPQVSVELRVPITMPGVVAPPLRSSQEQPAAPRKPPSPSDAPPMGDAFAVPSQLAQPSAQIQMHPSGASSRRGPSARSNRWMWLAIVLIVVGGAVGTFVALQ